MCRRLGLEKRYARDGGRDGQDANRSDFAPWNKWPQPRLPGCVSERDRLRTQKHEVGRLVVSMRPDDLAFGIKHGSVNQSDGGHFWLPSLQ